MVPHTSGLIDRYGLQEIKSATPIARVPDAAVMAKMFTPRVRASEVEVANMTKSQQQVETELVEMDEKLKGVTGSQARRSVSKRERAALGHATLAL
jgi:hypothetical protein